MYFFMHILKRNQIDLKIRFIYFYFPTKLNSYTTQFYILVYNNQLMHNAELKII